MPREQINFPKDSLIINRFGLEIEHELDVDVPDSSVVVNEPTLHVAWQNDNPDNEGHVQVYIDLDVNHLKHKIAGLSDDVIKSAIFTPSLSRQEINRLIRVLRTARDKAYGRDE
jgi:hypothetical protein